LNGTLVMVVATFAIVMLVSVRTGLVVDGWMALVSGREIAQHGVPTHDALTVWAHGRRWVDQQWLAQLLIYWLARAGGFKLALLVHAGRGVGALAAAATAARRLRGSARAAPWICLLISPYAVQLPSYYHQVLVGGDFSHFVTEWAPTTLSLTTAPVYLLVIGGVWLLGRAGGRISTFEKLVFLASSVLAFQAV